MAHTFTNIGFEDPGASALVAFGELDVNETYLPNGWTAVLSGVGGHDTAEFPTSVFGGTLDWSPFAERFDALWDSNEEAIFV